MDIRATVVSYAALCLITSGACLSAREGETHGTARDTHSETANDAAGEVVEVQPDGAVVDTGFVGVDSGGGVVGVEDVAPDTSRPDAHTEEVDATLPEPPWPPACDVPKPIVHIREGEEVIPQTVLHLFGSESVTPAGCNALYEWSVVQPVGSQSVFAPSAYVADPIFEANVVGTYEFELVVRRPGDPTAHRAWQTLYVTPAEAVHIELLWDTPEDPDQSDENGADLDLHFLHPLAAGTYDGDGDGLPDGWFDSNLDCFWDNEQPNWASADFTIDDNPGLDRDDVDGAGPENLNLNRPELGATYRIGVHYWDDHDFGWSTATVRIYIFAQLVFDVTDVALLKDDLWEVTSLTWPPGAPIVETRVCSEAPARRCATDADCAGACGRMITRDYEHPDYFQP